ncbi:hypothetical protein ACLI09_14170 [Flavobacterium sp. RHBU_24]|uniref:hypothetical protein n=1 Tax=Flavobacterium sp. RHBU_24 TaxID=3391185 RepID=UPI0039852994
MKTVEKIVVAGIVGTTFMTLYSYLKARKEHQEYVEPVMINKLIDNSANLPEIDDNHSNASGYMLHYATGIGFMAAYYLLWEKALVKPTFFKVLVLGALSGAFGIAVWKFMFAHHNNAPSNYRRGYYRQLFIAHIIFTLFAVPTYKALGNGKD